MILPTKYTGRGAEVSDNFFAPKHKEASIKELGNLIILASGTNMWTVWYRQTRDIYDALEARGLLDWYQQAFDQAKAEVA